jgi:hypothetical protein
VCAEENATGGGGRRGGGGGRRSEGARTPEWLRASPPAREGVARHANRRRREVCEQASGRTRRRKGERGENASRPAERIRTPHPFFS